MSGCAVFRRCIQKDSLKPCESDTWSERHRRIPNPTGQIGSQRSRLGKTRATYDSDPFHRNVGKTDESSRRNHGKEKDSELLNKPVSTLHPLNCSTVQRPWGLRLPLAERTRWPPVPSAVEACAVPCVSWDHAVSPKKGRWASAAPPWHTIAARNFARHVAVGSAAHSDHGRDLAFTLKAAANGEAKGFQVRDPYKLKAVAGHLDIPTEGRSNNDIANDVADAAIAQFGQQKGELPYPEASPGKALPVMERTGTCTSRD